jgi:hypothetical protein
MYLIKSLGGSRSPAHVVRRIATKDEWLDEVAAHQWVMLKPPASWLIAQEAKGRDVSAATAIWYKRYERGDRLTAWIVATDDDFYRAGYME